MRDCRSRTVVVLLVVLTAACGMSRVHIAGNSMSPTLKDGESALVSRTFDTLARGDVVAFRYPKDESKSFVQRIVGLPGDSIQSTSGSISINGQPLPEAYVAEANRSHDTWGPRTIPAGEYFMMGDNRSNSSDSRSWGMVRRELVWAKLILN